MIKLWYSTPGRCNAIVLFAVAIACSCSTTRSKPGADVNEPHSDLVVDKDGNKYAVKSMLDNNLWMTANLKSVIPASFCYPDGEDCERYGRVYTWEAAQQGCALLGEGWRLPANAEWQNLAALYGGNPEDSVENRKRAYQRLIDTGDAGFNAAFGGGRDPDGQYRRIGAHGFYWTATERNDSTAWFANFGKNSKALYHQKEGDKRDAFCVRCVRSESKSSVTKP